MPYDLLLHTQWFEASLHTYILLQWQSQNSNLPHLVFINSSKLVRFGNHSILLTFLQVYKCLMEPAPGQAVLQWSLEAWNLTITCAKKVFREATKPIPTTSSFLRRLPSTSFFTTLYDAFYDVGFDVCERKNRQIIVFDWKKGNRNLFWL